MTSPARRIPFAPAWLAACAAGLALAAAAPRPSERAGAGFGREGGAQPAFRTAKAQDADPLGVGRLIADLPFRTLDGESTTLAKALEGRRAVVLCMTSATCPLSIKYGPRLTRLAAEYDARGVAFLMLNVADTDSLGDMRRQARTLDWKSPYLPDQDRALRRALRARTTTEAIVIDAGRTLVYRGAVDDQHGVGTSLDAPRREFLRDALEATLRGRTPRVRATWPPGCVLGAEPAAAPAPPHEITYHNRISRIVQERCLDCHSQDRVAPFALASYESIVGRAPMIEAVIREGIMPPWHAAPPDDGGPSGWTLDRSLSASEREDLLAWLRSDRPIGDAADAPVAREFPAGWLLGTPDQMVISPSLDVPVEGPMVYAALPIETGLCEEVWISSIEMLPRRRDSIHHALLYIVPAPGADGADADPAEGADPARNLVAVYGPGDSTVVFGPDAALRLPAGASLLLHTYSLPMGTPHRANMRVGLTFAKEPPAMEVRTAAVTAPDLVIPAGERTHEVTATLELTRETRITALIPSMRSHGAAIRYEALLPDEPEAKLLLEVPRYDYKWRERYELAEAIELPASTTIRVTAVYDNSAVNPNNADPEREVRAGWATTDDILLGAFEYVIPRE